MTFEPLVSLTKSGDAITVSIRQKYHPRGQKAAYRWRLAGQFSLKELTKMEEKNSGHK